MCNVVEWNAFFSGNVYHFAVIQTNRCKKGPKSIKMQVFKYLSVESSRTVGLKQNGKCHDLVCRMRIYFGNNGTNETNASALKVSVGGDALCLIHHPR